MAGKGVFQRHGVWTVNPDGTRLRLFFGNTILDPNAFWQCAPVPGRPEVVSTFGGHHAGPYGVVGLLWNRLGDEAPRGEGFHWLTPILFGPKVAQGMPRATAEPASETGPRGGRIMKKN